MVYSSCGRLRGVLFRVAGITPSNLLYAFRSLRTAAVRYVNYTHNKGKLYRTAIEQSECRIISSYVNGSYERTDNNPGFGTRACCVDMAFPRPLLAYPPRDNCAGSAESCFYTGVAKWDRNLHRRGFRYPRQEGSCVR